MPSTRVVAVSMLTVALLAAAPWSRPACAEDPTGVIPSVRATVSGLRFFEGASDPAPPQQRRYDDRFLYSAARFVHWELDLIHSEPTRPGTFAIEDIWHGPRGLGYRKTWVFRVQPDWMSSFWSGSARLPIRKVVGVAGPGDWGVRCRGALGEWGPCEGGSQVEIAYWPRGSYRVDLVVDRRLVATGQFSMLGKEELDRELRAKLADRHRPAPQLMAIRGQVESLRLFEGGLPSPRASARRYSTRFAKAAVRNVGWELAVKHPPASRWIPLTFEALWYRAENSGDRLVLRKVLQTAVSADWRDTRFLDDAEPGAPATWPAGGYRVDVWVDRTKIASESFDIR